MVFIEPPSSTRIERSTIQQHSYVGKRISFRIRSRGFSPPIGKSARTTLSVVRAEHVAELVADLPDRDACPQRVSHRQKQIAVALGDATHLGQRVRRLVRASLGANLRRPLELAALRLRVEAMELDRLRL